jgi:Spy/CpxP family protein refolding chaperone
MFAFLLGGGLVAAGIFSLCCGRGCRHRWMLRHFYRRIGATDAQKERISTLIGETRERLEVAKSKARSLRVDLADVLSSNPLETARIESLEAKLFEVVGEGTQIARQFLAQVHETLDERQRLKVAQWLRQAHACGPRCQWEAT